MKKFIGVKYVTLRYEMSITAENKEEALRIIKGSDAELMNEDLEYYDDSQCHVRENNAS